MPEMRLVPAATCDFCGCTAEVVVVGTDPFVEVEAGAVEICKPCTRAIIKKFEEGDGLYG